MKNATTGAWSHFQSRYFDFPEAGLALDLSRMVYREDYFELMHAPMRRVFTAMKKLEQGAIANPDEGRQVGHYWLRNSALAPSESFRMKIDEALISIKKFTSRIHTGTIKGQKGTFENLVIIGIGGSALGPQFVAQALGDPQRDALTSYYLDNTDPDGMDRVLRGRLRGKLGRTLVLVISKSGGTKETRNGMLEAKLAYEAAKLDFSKHAVAITQDGSQLHQLATKEGWLALFPMWEWVGGRTSETSAVGLLPAALQGIDIGEFLKGAGLMDEITRRPDIRKNPAALLALCWYHAGQGRGSKDMVILPYKDRLELLSKYLQQLIMESLGKELDRQGRIVNQGIAVYGNKGSTDQHSYVQQLREGVPNFFATFIEVLRHRSTPSAVLDRSATSGDYLMGYLLGTRQALFDKSRESLTITIADVTPFSVGSMIALYERAVGFYAELVDINAYHQPGVEAGKKAAESILDLQDRVVRFLRSNQGQPSSAEQLALALGETGRTEEIFKICQHLAANSDRGVIVTDSHKPLFSRQYLSK